jgi:hypothetical protein
MENKRKNEAWYKSRPNVILVGILSGAVLILLGYSIYARFGVEFSLLVLIAVILILMGIEKSLGSETFIIRIMIRADYHLLGCRVP